MLTNIFLKNELMYFNVLNKRAGTLTYFWEVPVKKEKKTFKIVIKYAFFTILFLNSNLLGSMLHFKPQNASILLHNMHYNR